MELVILVQDGAGLFSSLVRPLRLPHLAPLLLNLVLLPRQVPGLPPQALLVVVQLRLLLIYHVEQLLFFRVDILLELELEA